MFRKLSHINRHTSLALSKQSADHVHIQKIGAINGVMSNFPAIVDSGNLDTKMCIEFDKNHHHFRPLSVT